MLRQLIFHLKTARAYVGYKINKYIPFDVIIAVTNQCNLKCGYCLLRYCQSRKLNLSKEDLFSVIDSCSELRTPFISFTGGEPLLLKYTEEAGLYAKKKSIITNLNTNGTLINKRRAIAITSSFDYIRVSLNGNESAQDCLSNMRGAFTKAVRGINYLIENKGDAKLGLNILLSPDNEDDVSWVVKNFKDKVDFISILPKVSFDQRLGEGTSKVPKKVLKIYNKLLSKKKCGNLLLDMKPSVRYGRSVCDGGRLYFSVSPSGDVYACNHVSLSTRDSMRMGNIRETPLIDIYKRYKPKKVRNKRICKGCYSTCSTEVSRVFRMNPFRLMLEYPKLRKAYLK